MSLQYNLPRTENVKSIVFKNTDPAAPIVNPTKITSFNESGLEGNILSKEFRTSNDNRVFSNWQALTIANLQALVLTSNLYIEVRYNRSGIAAGNIQGFILIYDTEETESVTPIDSSIDATYFGGELPSYYLDARNHTNEGTSDQSYQAIQDASIVIALANEGLIQNAMNVGDGSAGVFRDVSDGTVLTFRSLVGANGVNVIESGDLISLEIDASFAGGEVNVASNVGTGTGLYSYKTGVDLNFRSLSGLGTVTLTQDVSNVYIDVSTFDLDMNGNLTFVRGNVDTVQDVDLIRFNNQSGNDVSAGLMDITFGPDNLSSSANAFGGIAIGQGNMPILSPVSEFQGGRNIAVGYQIANNWGVPGSNNLMTHNIFMGRRAHYNNNDEESYKIAIGYEAMANWTGTPSNGAVYGYNIAMGLYALGNIDVTAVDQSGLYEVVAIGGFDALANTKWVPHFTMTGGTVGGGPFQEGEPVTQAVTGATGVFLSLNGAGNPTFYRTGTTQFDQSNQITGTNSSATYTPTGGVAENPFFGNVLAIGEQAGEGATGEFFGSVMIGYEPGQDAVFMEYYQTLIGWQAGSLASLGRGNIAIGAQSMKNSTGGSPGSTGTGTNQFNIYIGTHAGEGSDKGYKNTYVGTEAGGNQNASGDNVVRGEYNSGFGTWTLGKVTGDYNSALGAYAGYQSGSNHLVGDHNTFIGHSTAWSTANNEFSSVLVIGNPPDSATSTGGYRPEVSTGNVYIGSIRDIFLETDWDGTKSTYKFSNGTITDASDNAIFSDGGATGQIPFVGDTSVFEYTNSFTYDNSVLSLGPSTKSIHIGNNVTWGNGNESIVMGWDIDMTNVGANTIALGSYALAGNSPTISQGNIAIGGYAGNSVDGVSLLTRENIIMGYNSASQFRSGQRNTIIGPNTGDFRTGNYNLILGENNASALWDGSVNIIIGWQIEDKVTGNYDLFLGAGNTYMLRGSMDPADAWLRLPEHTIFDSSVVMRGIPNATTSYVLYYDQDVSTLSWGGLPTTDPSLYFATSGKTTLLGSPTIAMPDVIDLTYELGQNSDFVVNVRSGVSNPGRVYFDMSNTTVPFADYEFLDTGINFNWFSSGFSNEGALIMTDSNWAFYYFNGANTKRVTANNSTKGIVFTDSVHEVGIVYQGNYFVEGASVGDRWVPDWAAVRDHLAGFDLSTNVLSLTSAQDGSTLAWNADSSSFVLTSVSGGGSSLTVGANDRIPISNSSSTDFDYDGGFTRSGTAFNTFSGNYSPEMTFSNPVYTFRLDTDTGVGRNATNDVALYAGTTSQPQFSVALDTNMANIYINVGGSGFGYPRGGDGVIEIAAADTNPNQGGGAGSGTLYVDGTNGDALSWLSATGNFDLTANATQIAGQDVSTNVLNVGTAQDGSILSWNADTSTYDFVPNLNPLENIIVAASDETTDITTGTAKVTFRMPYALNLTEVRASVNVAPTDASIIVDINEGGATILSTKLSIDSGEKTSTTAASQAVISDSALADDAEITVDIDQVGSTVAGKGLKVTLIGRKP